MYGHYSVEERIIERKKRIDALVKKGLARVDKMGSEYPKSWFVVTYFPSATVKNAYKRIIDDEGHSFQTFAVAREYLKRKRAEAAGEAKPIPSKKPRRSGFDTVGGVEEKETARTRETARRTHVSEHTELRRSTPQEERQVGQDGNSEHNESRVGKEFQAVVPVFRDKRIGVVHGDKIDDATSAPDELFRCVDVKETLGIPRTDVCESYGTCLWVPGIVSEEDVSAYLECAKKITSRFARFDEVCCLNMLAQNNYDLRDTIRRYLFMQNCITKEFEKRSVQGQ